MTSCITEKYCKLCSTMKPATCFQKRHNGAGGLQSYCAVCLNARRMIDHAKRKAIVKPSYDNTLGDIVAGWVRGSYG